MPQAPTPSLSLTTRFAPLVRAFHGYANWLVSISWKRFFALSLLLIIAMAILKDLPPFTWTLSERIEDRPTRAKALSIPPTPPAAPSAPGGGATKAPEPFIKIEKGAPGSKGGIEIQIGSNGIRITPDATATAPAAAAVEAAAGGIRIVLPPGATSDAVREAVEQARKEIESAVAQARQDADQARRDAEEARRDAQTAIAEIGHSDDYRGTRVTRVGFGDALPTLAFLWIVISIIIKVTYKGQLQAQAQAAQATEVAESEQLRRQVVEARMAAMQAQVEPHFLFNTLASIDHLIETDPARASTMQKNLIALLRASMPTMREANQGGPRDLGREMAVIRPYLEILKVRMEERLSTRIDVPDGLLSAEFPSMMIQSLVENAIKHGLEPKPEGGELAIKAEIVHGKLTVTVADTGLGFGRAATAGTGVGLANIRERLALLYAGKATLSVNKNQPSGTVVTIAVPYATAQVETGAPA